MTTATFKTILTEFYDVMLSLLDRFYPERSITVTSADPDFVTPTIKAQLRKKNRLMRAGRTEEAGDLAKRIRAAIIRQDGAQLRHVDTRRCAKDTWAKIRQLTGVVSDHGASWCDDVSQAAQMMNDHYAAVSADAGYRFTQLKQTAAPRHCLITAESVFRALDHLRPTATGLDNIPAWFLRLSAPIFSCPIAQLYNQSISCGVVPRQWKSSYISPISKVTHLLNQLTTDPSLSPPSCPESWRDLDLWSEPTSIPPCNSHQKGFISTTSLPFTQLALPLPLWSHCSIPSVQCFLLILSCVCSH